ncbi:MAG: hypothetical protein INR71_00975, partial [Terriglobus roseus]|nr:hypothetical protein [Terriglobus roseus]
GRFTRGTSSPLGAAALPPVPANHSHAYGATGRTLDSSPAQLGTASSSFASAIDTNRTVTDADPHEGDHITVGRRTSLAVTPGPSTARRAPISPIIEETDPSPQASRHSSHGPQDGATNNTFSFGEEHEGGLMLNNPPAPLGRLATFQRWLVNLFLAASAWIGNRLPNPLALFALGMLLAYCLSLSVGKEIPQTDGTPLRVARESLLANPIFLSVSNVARALDPTSHLVASFQGMSRDVAQGVVREELGSLNARIDDITTRLDHLEDSLPELVVVRSKGDGEGFELLDHFWEALRSKLAPAEVTRSPSRFPWDGWFSRNEFLVQELARARTDLDHDAAITWGLNNYRVVSREEVVRIVKDQHRDYVQRFDAHTEAVLDKKLREKLRDLQRMYADGSWIMRMVDNSRMALESVNFFNPKIGAVVIPSLTSPTATQTASRWRGWAYQKLSHLQPRPPIEALQRWEEMGDCWCSAGSGKTRQGSKGDGQAQLGVVLARPTFPERLVVEHLPPAGTLDPGTTPRNIELWVHVPEERARQSLEKALDVTRWDRACDDRGSLPENFVCAGAYTYDKNGANHVQTFRMDVDFEGLGIPVTKTVVRVRSTWGRAWTCLYRLRLLGKQAGGVDAMLENIGSSNLEK